MIDSKGMNREIVCQPRAYKESRVRRWLEKDTPKGETCNTQFDKSYTYINIYIQMEPLSVLQDFSKDLREEMRGGVPWADP